MMILRKNKKKLIAAASLAALVTSYFFGSHLIKSYIENKYPYLKISSSKFIWFGICFNDISVNKAIIKANLDEICIKGLNGPLTVRGGHASVSLAEMTGSSQNGRNEILDRFSSIYVSNIDGVVTKGNNTISVSGASYTRTPSDDYISFETAHAKYKDKEFDLTGGKIKRDFSLIEIQKVQAELKLPFKIPHIEAPEIIIASSIKIETKNKTATIKNVDYGFIYLRNTKAKLSLTELNITSEMAGINHAWLASKPIMFKNITALSKAPFKDFDIALGSAKIHLNLNDYQASGAGTCDSWAQALPKPNLFENTSQSFSGLLSFNVSVRPTPDFKLNSTCKFKCSSEPISSLFSTDGFSYSVYDKDNKPFARHIGPNEQGWTSIEEVAPDLLVAVSALEDPGFQGHNGIIPLAIKNSLLANLKDGKFTRGGSTITMQLAKNLWLNRQKVLLRKAEEIFLAFALESCLTKEQILEWYLNAVEFGPDIYGIRAATRYYFKKEPHELTAVEGFYLAKILPNPKGALAPDQGGLESAQKLMDHFAKSGFAVGL